MLVGWGACAAALLGLAVARAPGTVPAQPPQALSAGLPTRFDVPPLLPDDAAAASVLRAVQRVSLGSPAPRRPDRAREIHRDDLLTLAPPHAAAAPAAVPEPALVALALATAGGLRARSCRRRGR
jgi:hypothetical protein